MRGETRIAREKKKRALPWLKESERRGWATQHGEGAVRKKARRRKYSTLGRSNRVAKKGPTSKEARQKEERADKRTLPTPQSAKKESSSQREKEGKERVENPLSSKLGKWGGYSRLTCKQGARGWDRGVGNFEKEETLLVEGFSLRVITLWVHKKEKWVPR